MVMKEQTYINKEFLAFKECATRGAVYDKDGAQEALQDIGKHYATLGVKGGVLKPIIEPLQHGLYEGNRTEQVKTAITIFELDANLGTATNNFQRGKNHNDEL